MANKFFYVHNGLTVGGLTVDAATGNLNTPGSIITTSTTAATTVTSGALQVRGGAGISGDLYVGGNIYDGGNLVLHAGNIGSYAVTTLTAGTDTVVSASTGAVTIWNNSTLQTITSRGATTNQAISITNATQANSSATGALKVTGGIGVGGNAQIGGDLNVWGNTTFGGTVTFNGTATYVYSANAYYTDNLIHLHESTSTQVGVPWTFDDGKDVGLKFHYFNRADNTGTAAGLILANDSQWLEWYDRGTEGTSSTFVGTSYGNFKLGQVWLTSGTNATSTITGALRVDGGAGIAKDLYVGGTIYAANISGPVSGTSSLTNSIVGGTAGQIVYQSAPNTTAFAGPGTAGQLLRSNGTSAPSYVNTGSILVGGADTVEVTASSVNASYPITFVSTTTGYLPTLVTDLLKVNPSTGELFATKFTGSGAGLTANSVPNSALQGSGQITVSAGTGIGVSGSPVALGGTVTITNFGVTQFLGGTTGLTSTNTTGTVTLTGTLGVANGGTNATGIGGAGSVAYSDGTRYQFTTGTTGQILVSAGTGAPVFTNTSSIYVGAALLADDVRGGTAGQLLYQSAANNTAFVGPGTAGQILVSNGANAPVYTNTSSIHVGTASFAITATNATQATNATNATNISGGAAGSIPIQSGAGATSFIPIGSAGTILQSNGTTATWQVVSGLSAGSATTATNLAGGTAGQVPYQTAAGLTSFYGPGTAGQLLQSNGTSAPSYVNTSSLLVGYAVTSTVANTVLSVQRTTNATHYITFVDTNDATPTADAIYTTSSFVVNPSTGRVGIGNAAPAARLDVSGDVRISGITTVSNDLNVSGDLYLTTSTSAIIQSETGVVVQNTAVTVDTWSSSTFRSAKYVVSVSRGTDAWQTTEILVIHGLGTAYMHDTSVFTTAAPIMNFDTTISGGNVLLQATGTTAANHTVKVHRLYLTA